MWVNILIGTILHHQTHLNAPPRVRARQIGGAIFCLKVKLLPHGGKHSKNLALSGIEKTLVGFRLVQRFTNSSPRGAHSS